MNEKTARRDRKSPTVVELVCVRVQYPSDAGPDLATSGSDRRAEEQVGTRDRVPHWTSLGKGCSIVSLGRRATKGAGEWIGWAAVEIPRFGAEELWGCS